MNRIKIFIPLALLMLAITAMPAYGQLHQPLQDDWGDMGGGGGWCYDDCMAYPVNGGNQVACAGSSINQSSSTFVYGYTSCTAHNAPVGPGYCEFSGTMCERSVIPGKLHIGGNDGNITVVDQTTGIGQYFVAAGLMTAEQYEDFIAAVDFSLGDANRTNAGAVKRLAVYRAKFKELVGHDLTPGAIPRFPVKRFELRRQRQRAVTSAAALTTFTK